MCRYPIARPRACGLLLLATFVCGVFSSGSRAQDPEALRQWGQRYEREILPLVQSHCLECHQGDDPSGEFDLSGFLTADSIVAKPLIWEQVGKRIRLNEMPPEGSRQFSDPEKGRVYAWLDARPQEDECRNLATDETQAWYKGFVMSRRLTKTEYLNAMRDLVGMEVDSRFEIPSDGAGGVGFDTNGSTLFTSPIHIEQYLAAADDLLQRAFDDPDTRRALLPSFEPSMEVTDQSRAALARFGLRAWRRPLGDGELDRLMRLYEFAQSQTPSDAGSTPRDESTEPMETSWPTNALNGLRYAMTGILISPNFLFVVEAEAPEGGVQRLSDYELATRLALFLWSSVPDEELLAAAAEGRLATEAGVLDETRRMLADPRARALGENFGLQWLGLSHFLTSAKPDVEVFPEFDQALAQDLREEVVRTIAGVFQENRPLLELIDSSTIVANGRLARYYGVDAEPDADWQRWDVTSLPRGGVITAGAVLMHTSYPRRTSPVLRGRWLLEEVLGARVPPPPPGVPPLEESVTEQVVSLRERLELHRRNPECAACHNRMDPLGFGLENFDALGRWRDDDHGVAIDAQGTLPGGQTFQGPDELKQVVLSRSEDFQRHFSRKMLGFALGRELTKFDDCVVDDCLEALAEGEHRSRAVVETIVTSFAFQHRYFKAAEAP